MESTKVATFLVLAIILMQISPTTAFGFRSVQLAAQAPKYGGQLIAAVNTDPLELIPAFQPEDVSQATCNNLFNKLVKFDQYFNICPDLATDWTISKDGLTYTFHLVKNATWHDGKPFTSEDVKFTYDYEKQYGAVAPRFKDIESIETPDKYTVVIKQKKINAAFMVYLAWGYTQIMPKHLYDGTDWKTNPQNQRPIGTGPFKFQEWVKGDHVTLVANENYFKGRPYLDKLIIKVIPDPQTALMAFEAGEIDALTMYRAPDFKDVPKLAARKDVTIIKWPYYTYWCLAFKMDHPIFGKMTVRQAIAHAIDRDTIVKTCFYGVPTPAPNADPLSPTLAWAWNPDAKNYEFNPAKAEKMLDDAGYPKGKDGVRFKATLDYQPYLPGDEDMWLMVKAMLHDIGVEVTLIKHDSASYREKVWNRNNLEMAWVGGGTGPDPSILRQRLGSEMFNNGNIGCYNNSKVDKLFDLALGTADQNERAKYYKEIGAIAAEELPRYPIYNIMMVEAWKGEFQGREPVGLFFAHLGNIWWTKGSELSPDSIRSAINSAEKEIESLRGQFYDVTGAQKQIEQAKKALEAGEYAKAYELAKGAVKLANPPYALYGGVAVVAVGVAVALVFLYRRKKPKVAV
jgi:peptide/nickel transport system substrate-binding protein